jgi:DNA-binding response OmpR family regulator
MFDLKILVVEDDLSTQKATRNGLVKFGYTVDTASDGEEALTLLEINGYDAVVLDLNLPKVDGIDVLREIRRGNQQLGVLILSARSEVEDKILGLDTGANDYMGKPFHIKELEARLRALTRRKFIQFNAVLAHGKLRVDTSLKSVFADGTKIDLTKKEYGILEYLMLHKKQPVSAEELIEHVWDSEADLFSNSCKVHINTLKKKLSPYLSDTQTIQNTRAVGYYLPEANDETV